MSRASNRKHTAKRAAKMRGRPLVSGLTVELDRIGLMIEEQRYAEALDGVHELARKHPNHVEIFESMLLAALELKDSHSLLKASVRLAELEPSVPDHRFNLAQAYLESGFPALAIHTGQELIRRWPAYERAGDVRKQVTELSQILHRETESWHFSREEWLDVFVINEQTQVAQTMGQWERARTLATSLAEREPRFLPAYNNRSLTWFMEGNLEEAAADARRALEIDPANVHALSNLVRFQRVGGLREEARSTAEKLKAANIRRSDEAAKVAEALAFMDDDAGVMDVAEHTKHSDPIVLHLAGVAASRLGDSRKARRFWLECAKKFPQFTRSAENLEDLERPPGQQEGAWPFELEEWVSDSVAEEYGGIVIRVGRMHNKVRIDNLRLDARLIVEKHPWISGLLPVLLERGDPSGRKFALVLARALATPETLGFLKDFAQGPYGTDKDRMACLQILRDEGVVPRGRLMPFWVGGEKTEVQVTDFRLDDQPYQELPREARKLSEAGVIALKEGRLEEGERFLLKAQELAPFIASIRHNLAVLKLKKGDVAGARSILEALAREHPQYGFALSQLALIELANDHLDTAGEILDRIGVLEHHNTEEYSTYCRARIYHALLAGTPGDAAKRWLSTWAQMLPDDTQIEEVRPLVGIPNLGVLRVRHLLASLRE